MAMRARIVGSLLNPRSWHALERSGLRRGASGGRVLGEEERAAENIYIKGFPAEEAKAAISGSPTVSSEAAKAAAATKSSTDGKTN
ncbi:hypothetical protein CY35_03G130200 [Sphagnum magellanicum]|nr:hypothetical protein CY35_03G130200 [Sphagnum magellanicum]